MGESAVDDRFLMPSAYPYMPFFVGDYRGDTGNLSTLEHGAYLLLLFHYWTKGESLPDDPEQLRIIAGVSRHVWRKISPKICEFFEKRDGRLFHKRVEEELGRARLKSLKAQEAGRKSAESRSALHSTSAERPLPPSTNLEATISSPYSEEEKNKSSSSLRSEEPRAEESDVLPAIPRRKRKAAGIVCHDPTLLKAFNVFWDIYPRKKERQFALETWVREIRPEFVPDVIQAAIRYAEIRRGEPEQFTRHAATWLNKGRWRDSLTDEKPKPPTGNGNGKPTVSERNRDSRAGLFAAFGAAPPTPDSGARGRSLELRGPDDSA